MNKTELIDAIQQVITPNGKKAISAESLANLLIEMVNATPEGGNAGAGQIVFYAGLPTGEVHEAIDLPIFSPNAEQKAHNVEMFNTIKSLPYMPVVSFDLSEYYMELMSQDTGLDTTGTKFSATGFTTSYIPKDVALLEGLDKEFLLISGVGNFYIFSDGTTAFEF